MTGRTITKVAGMLLLLAGLAGCGGQRQGTTTADGAVASVVVSASLAGTPIATMLVTVSAADIPVPLAFNLLIQDGFASGTLRVPPGTMRTFAASAFDSRGNVTHEGLIAVDVQPGQNPPLAIVMTPRPGQVGITIYLGRVSIQVSPPEATLQVGGRLSFSAVVRDADGASIPGDVQWASFNPGIVSVDPATGEVVCGSPGTAKVAAVFGGVAGDATVNCSGGTCANDPAVGTPCGSGVGACLPGSWQCAGEQLVCSGAIGPSTEVCNGLDDNCDGVVDEGCGGGFAVCGNGFVEPGEQCDDQNGVSGDGCSDACMLEPGFTCYPVEPTYCEPMVCGDGLVRGAEQCDDGNATPGDGCDASCQVEPGFGCRGEPSICKVPACGDGLVDVGETCDDGNVVNGDGCGATCQAEPGFLCQGEPSTCSVGPYRHTVAVDGNVLDYAASAERFPSGTPDVATFVTWDDSFFYMALQQPPAMAMGGPELWWDVYVDFQGGGTSLTDLYPGRAPLLFPAGFQPEVLLSTRPATGEALAFLWSGVAWQPFPPLQGMVQVAVNPASGVVELSVNRGPLGQSLAVTSVVVRDPYGSPFLYGGLYPGAVADGAPAGIASWLQVDFQSTLPPASPANRRPPPALR